jgi:excisionase family DNA binding protein
MTKLALVPVHGKISEALPAAFHENAAAKYIGTNRTHFRDLVVRGNIPFVVHQYGKTRLYLKSDLDDYLLSRPKHKIVDGRKPADGSEEKDNERQN